MNPYWNTEQIHQNLHIDGQGNCDLLPTYAQLKQDTRVVEHYQSKKGGYYVDIGAHDGLSFSNTYLLDRAYGWTGICVEPLPDVFQQLINNRKNAICVQAAIFNRSELKLDFTTADMFSGIVGYIDCHEEGKTAQTIKVNTLSMTDLLKRCNAPHWIEYLTIDTEGSELEVLQSIDYSNYRFGLIHIEHNYVEPRRSLMRKLLQSQGYVHSREIQWDDEYIWVGGP
jgi:FkbM family methyltransferase